MQVITAAAKCGATDVPQPRLVRAAHEFEAQLMKELLRPLTVLGDDNAEEPGSNPTLGEFAGEVLGQSLSSRGGFGISASILRSISQTDAAGEPNANRGKEFAANGTVLK